MRVYAESSALRTRQILLDAVTALWVFAWVRIGMRIFELVDLLQGPGRSLEQAGTTLAERAGDLGANARRLPVIGGALRGPFRAIGDGGRFIQDAGIAQQSAVHTLAIWLGVVIAGLPIMWALARYLPGRISWIREAAAATKVRAAESGLALFALRALVHQPLSTLVAVCPDPMGAYQRGDFEALAALELRDLGLLTASAS